MTDKPVSLSNGKIAFGFKELLSLSVLLVGLGSTWAIQKAKAAELDSKIASLQGQTDTRLETIVVKVDGDHETLRDVKSDVKHLLDDLEGVKADQAKVKEHIQKQEVLSAQILAEIKSLSSKNR